MFKYLNIMVRGRLARMEERGATAVEYGLLVALIAAVIVGVVVALGDQLADVFEGITDDIENNPPAEGEGGN